jgi:TolB protein
VTAERFSENNTRYTLQRSDYDGARAVTLLQSREPILSPRFAPDGKRIAYVSFEQKRPRIFMQNIDTGRREQITNFEGLNGAPAWSPDGNRLAFVLSKDGNPDIYVMNLGSRQITRVTAARHQHRTVLGQGWFDHLLHFRPWRQAADLQNSVGGGGAERDLHR